MKVKASVTWEIEGEPPRRGEPSVSLLSESGNDLAASDLHHARLLRGTSEQHGDLHQLDIGGYVIKDGTGTVYGYVHVEQASTLGLQKYEHWALNERFTSTATAGKQMIFQRQANWAAESDFLHFLSDKGSFTYITVDCHTPRSLP